MQEKTLDDVKQEIDALEVQLKAQGLTQTEQEDLQMRLNSLRKHLSRMAWAESAAPVQTHDAEGLVLPEFQQEFEQGCDHSSRITYADGSVRCAHCSVLLEEPKPAEESPADEHA